MRTDELIDRSIHIITEYYRNNLEPFFEAISDDVLWIGPSERQYIRGRSTLMETFARERHALTFTMGDIKVMCVAPQDHVREVVLHYDVLTHYPSGTVIPRDQRLHFTWRERRLRDGDARRWEPELVLIHISNAWRYDPADTIYPVHYEAIARTVVSPAEPDRFLTLRAIDGIVHRVAASRIVYVETVKRSARLVVHTGDDAFAVGGTLSAFERDHPGDFVRIHASYLVNPAAVRKIRRFSVTLSDGAVLPIPEKRYTEVKRLLLDQDL